ncbi:VanZ family protein [Listeria rocourtiae]|uniref:VanZ family protein n=1 Tax=Listeria rocourtiae TaxID=647910 RepID=UPI003D2F7DD9
MEITYDPFIIIILAIAILVVMAITLRFLLQGKKLDSYYFATALLGVYLVFLIKFVIFPFTIFENLLDAGSYAVTDYINVVPFKQLIDGSMADWHQAVGNVLLLFPLGIYIGVLKGNLYFGKFICIGLLISLMIESVQLFLDIVFIYPNHFMDVTDVILNVSGFTLAYFVSRTEIVRKMYPMKNDM